MGLSVGNLGHRVKVARLTGRAVYGIDAKIKIFIDKAGTTTKVWLQNSALKKFAGSGNWASYRTAVAMGMNNSLKTPRIPCYEVLEKVFEEGKRYSFKDLMNINILQQYKEGTLREALSILRIKGVLKKYPDTGKRTGCIACFWERTDGSCN